MGQFYLFHTWYFRWKPHYPDRICGKIKIPYHKVSEIKSDDEILPLDDNRTFDGIIEDSEDNLLKIAGNDQEFSFSEIRHLWNANSTDPLILLLSKVH